MRLTTLSLCGNPLFWIELSLPRVVYGYNWPMIPDIPTAIDALDALFHDCPALPYIPTAADGQIMRLDACYNYPVGDALPDYLRALSKLEYPRRQTAPFMGTGVEYRSASASGHGDLAPKNESRSNVSIGSTWR